MTIDGSKFYTSLRAWKKQTRMNSTETIYQRYLQKKGDCQEYKAVIDYFIYLHEDEGINEMPIEALDRLRNAVNALQTLIDSGQELTIDKKYLEMAIGEGNELLTKISVSNPPAV